MVVSLSVHDTQSGTLKCIRMESGDAHFPKALIAYGRPDLVRTCDWVFAEEDEEDTGTENYALPGREFSVCKEFRGNTGMMELMALVLAGRYKFSWLRIPGEEEEEE